MAKKLISIGDLEWIFVEQLRESSRNWVGVSVISEGEGDWRVVIPVRTRSYMRADTWRQVAAIEKRLRSIYALAA
ncbi:hypothetical protein [uncultured Bradyrhizobium sp.]|jgi:hypothetical protein|uniref:hypothetical protein n=1 Tax=uncultured Bradyrhizobium sp. TaxID=199684 RepID=UPI00261C8717|nr:hypothetical protein [uncultured Bradyrhizobium sp.]